MEWITANWVFILFFIIFIATHLFGHGMHGGCGGTKKEEGHSGKDFSEKKENEKEKGG
ncbi:MAG: DUF2933 domain-containing protein [Nitrospirae bacterium]|nr:DUF2933 domain-containing protein [Nitrospirota bacterium]